MPCGRLEMLFLMFLSVLITELQLHHPGSSLGSQQALAALAGFCLRQE